MVYVHNFPWCVKSQISWKTLDSGTTIWRENRDSWKYCETFDGSQVLIFGDGGSFHDVWDFRKPCTFMCEAPFCCRQLHPSNCVTGLDAMWKRSQYFIQESYYWQVTERVQNWTTLKFMTMKSFLQYHLIYLALNQYLSSLLGNCMMVSFLSSTKGCKKEENL